MAFTYSKFELMEDLQKVFAKHNVRSIEVEEPGALFSVEEDGSLRVGARATIVAFDTQPGEKPTSKFKVIDGGNDS